jgi:predicted acyl esterase
MVADHRAFFDHWLKGIDNGVMDRPPVRLEIRSGNGSSYLQEENEWPSARTRYTRLYLDANPSTWQRDSRRDDLLRLSRTEPSHERQVSYSAEVDAGAIGGLPPAFTPRPAPTTTPPWSTGVSFISDPMTDDTVLAEGWKVTDPQALADIGPVPDHETLIEIPEDVLKYYARRYQQEGEDR